MPNMAYVTLIGHIGRDPEFATLPNGTPILKLSLAVSTGYGDYYKEDALKAGVSGYFDKPYKCTEYNPFHYSFSGDSVIKDCIAYNEYGSSY